VSSCYCCNKVSNAVAGTDADQTNPHGGCAICGVFCCDGHAVRDAKVRRFQCVLCVPSLLAASAAQGSSRTTTAEALPLSDSERELAFRSVHEFEERLPELAEMVPADSRQHFLASAQRRFTTGATESLWFSLDETGQELLAAAVLLVRSLGISSDELPPALLAMTEAWHP
jgi:hypothetical protein